jgi:hypothetical protein
MKPLKNRMDASLSKKVNYALEYHLYQYFQCFMRPYIYDLHNLKPVFLVKSWSKLSYKLKEELIMLISDKSLKFILFLSFYLILQVQFILMKPKFWFLSFRNIIVLGLDQEQLHKIVTKSMKIVKFIYFLPFDQHLDLQALLVSRLHQLRVTQLLCLNPTSTHIQPNKVLDIYWMYLEVHG